MLCTTFLAKSRSLFQRFWSINLGSDMLRTSLKNIEIDSVTPEIHHTTMYQRTEFWKRIFACASGSGFPQFVCSCLNHEGVLTFQLKLSNNLNFTIWQYFFNRARGTFLKINVDTTTPHPTSSPHPCTSQNFHENAQGQSEAIFQAI